MPDHSSRFYTARLRLPAAVAGVITAAALGPVPAVAEEPPAGEAAEPYPPYPEVWGRELPYPGDDSYSIHQEVFEAPDGRVIVDIYASPLRSDEFEFRVLDFFSGEMRTIDKKTSYDIRSGGKHKRLYTLDIELADGGRLTYESRRVSNCTVTYNIHYVKRDRDGEIVADKMLLHLYDRPVRVGVDPYCEISSDRAHFHQNWRQVGLAFAPLKDGTFLAYDGPFIIRFDPDLNAPFIDNKRLFLLDRAVVMDLVDEGFARDGPSLQNIDDVIYDYLIKLREETTNAPTPN